jgi:ribose transport system permease protein
VLVAVILQRTPLGRYIYAIGNKEAAAYLAGVDTRRVTVICFVLCGLAAALAGVLLAGYSTKAYQAMGDAYLAKPDCGRAAGLPATIIITLLSIAA